MTAAKDYLSELEVDSRLVSAMSRSCADLPDDVKALFPKENLEFAHHITSDEATVLKEVFAEHDCFERVGEMIEAVKGKSPSLGEKMQFVLEQNKSRLAGLSPAATEFCKKVIDYVTQIQCNLTLGRDLCHKRAGELRAEFATLSEEDRTALKKNNPELSAL